MKGEQRQRSARTCIVYHRFASQDNLRKANVVVRVDDIAFLLSRRSLLRFARFCGRRSAILSRLARYTGSLLSFVPSELPGSQRVRGPSSG